MAVATPREQAPGWLVAVPWANVARATTGVVVALAILFLLRDKPIWAVTWLFGLGFGFVLQRARFCFASSFRDLFLLRDGRVMRAVLLGMAVATVGFAFAMYNLSPTIVDGRNPANANVLPLGFHTVFAGFIFAIGMTLAGGCMSGSLYRMGEGYVASWVTMLGIMIGFFLLGHTWNFWWDLSYTRSVTVWFPHYAGWLGGIAITLSLILLAYLAVVWWESRGGARAQEWREEDPPSTPGMASDLSRALRGVFVKSWPILAAGAILGVMNTFYYFYHHPWGVTGGLYEWMDAPARLLGIAPGPLKGLDGTSGACVVGDARQELVLGMSHMSILNIGMVLGSFGAAALAGEFRLRLPKHKRRYLQSLGGGILMGYAAALALGCTLGAFFSAVPSLALNGWGFALGLLPGAFIGVKLIRKIG